MKGSIPLSLQKMVQEKFGDAHWNNILVKTGLPENHTFYVHHDVDDEIIKKALENTLSELNISMVEAAEAFGDYWVNTFAPNAYFAFFTSSKSAKEFLMGMDKVHERITSNIENAAPPQFKYEDVDENTLIMTYISKRGLEELWIGLIKGTAKYFNEKVAIERLEKNKVKITFGSL